MTDKRIDDQAAETLARTAWKLAQNVPVQRLALMAYIQSAMTQCAVQVLVNFLKRKNMIPDSELTRALAEAYDDFANQIRTGEIVTPSAPVTKPNGH